MDVCDILRGKRILFFSQVFFGYENRIKNKMEECGASVDMYDEMSVTSPFQRACLKISPRIFSNKSKKYYKNILDEVKNKDYDYVLFIDGEMLDIGVYNIYKSTFPKAKFCLHLWDSVSNLKGVEKLFSKFDYVTTFDRLDSKRYNLKLRPLFYSDEYRIEEARGNIYYDLCFIGTIHSDRFKIIKDIEKALPQEKKYIYPYLQSHFIYYFYKLTRKEFRKTKIEDFKFEKLDPQYISDVINKSNCILDMQHPKQTGLTMRTFEILGMNKKMITTNQDIINYEFYNKNNIYVIDRKKPYIEKEFFNTPYEYLPKEEYEKYSIVSWIKDVLGI